MDKNQLCKKSQLGLIHSTYVSEVLSQIILVSVYHILSNFFVLQTFFGTENRLVLEQITKANSYGYVVYGFVLGGNLSKRTVDLYRPSFYTILIAKYEQINEVG